MKKTRWFAGALAILMACPVFLASCGSETSEAVSVVAAAQYVPEETVSALQEQLDAKFPAEEGAGCTVTGISSGDSESDPMAAMAGMMKLTSMIAAKEVDVLVTSLEEGEKQAKNASFMPLEELFTEEELAGLELVSFDIQNDDGTPDEENSKACGVKLTSGELSQLTNGGAAVFVVVNTEHLDQAKEVLLQIAELYQ